MGLLRERQLNSQEAVIEELARRGIETTQATVSRDLSEIGAVKVRVSDGTLVYQLSTEFGSPAARERLSDVVRRFVIRVDATSELVVLRTPEAGAAPLASAIDRADFPGVLATVAGDDTVLVVAEPAVGGQELADRFRGLAEPA